MEEEVVSTCERHGCEIVDHTLYCGAPQCCPQCCKEAELEANVSDQAERIRQLEQELRRARLEAKIEALMEFRLQVGNGFERDRELAIQLDGWRAELAMFDAKERK